jgi:ribA/ribD-fused uncharacterized protein
MVRHRTRGYESHDLATQTQLGPLQSGEPFATLRYKFSASLTARAVIDTIMPPKRKANAAGRANKTSTESDTIFFYMPGEKPFGVFCQWHTSPIIVPTASLHFLTTAPSSKSDKTSLLVLKNHAPSMTFTCAEQLYMFSKALYFSDATSCTHILATSDPKTQKELGQAVKNFNEYKWTLVKSRVACVGNWYKFTNPANRHMKNVLLGTAERELAEAARRDRVWGIGYNAEEAERYRKMWGENRLGRALMAVRGTGMEWTT